MAQTQNPPPSHSYVLWSGGKDSTYLIWERLKAGHKVTAGYVTVDNNITKTKAELIACGKMAEFFRTTFGSDKFEFERIGSVGIDRNRNGLFFAQPLLWLLPTAYATALNMGTSTYDSKRYDEVCICYIMNDDAISYLEEFKGIWQAMAKLAVHGLPEITFPTSKICKETIIAGLPKPLLDLCVYCEMPHAVNEAAKRAESEEVVKKAAIEASEVQDYKPCGHCPKCVKEKTFSYHPHNESKALPVESVSCVSEEISFDI